MKLYITDTETCGLEGGICQIGQVIADINCSKILETRGTLVNPLKKISPSASGVHWITEKDIKHSPKFPDIMQEYLPEQGHFVAHNAKFDLRVMEGEGYHLPKGVKVLCTLELARELYHKSKVGDHKLGTMFFYLGCNEEVSLKGNTHDAVTDCQMTFYVLRKMLLDNNLTIDKAWKLCNTPIQDMQCDLKKYREQDITWQQVLDQDKSYCEWLIENYDFNNKWVRKGKEVKTWLEGELK